MSGSATPNQPTQPIRGHEINHKLREAILFRAQQFASRAVIAGSDSEAAYETDNSLYESTDYFTESEMFDRETLDALNALEKDYSLELLKGVCSIISSYTHSPPPPPLPPPTPPPTTPEMMNTAGTYAADGSLIPEEMLDPRMAPYVLGPGGKQLVKINQQYLERNGWVFTEGSVKNGWKYTGGDWKRVCSTCQTSTGNLVLCKNSDDNNVHWTHDTCAASNGKCHACPAGPPAPIVYNPRPSDAAPTDFIAAVNAARAKATARASTPTPSRGSTSLAAQSSRAASTSSARVPQSPLRAGASAHTRARNSALGLASNVITQGRDDDDSMPEMLSDSDSDAPARERRRAKKAAGAAKRGRRPDLPTFGDQFDSESDAEDDTQAPANAADAAEQSKWKPTAAERADFFPLTPEERRAKGYELPDCIKFEIMTGFTSNLKRYEAGLVAKRLKAIVDQNLVGQWQPDRKYLYAHIIFSRGYKCAEELVRQLAVKYVHMNIKQRERLKNNCTTVIGNIMNPGVGKGRGCDKNYGPHIRTLEDYMTLVGRHIEKLYIQTPQLRDTMDNYKYFFGRYITWGLDGFALQPMRNQQGVFDPNGKIGSKYASLEQFHTHMLRMSGLCAPLCDDEQLKSLGCNDKADHDDHKKRIQSATVASISKKVEEDPDVHNNYERNVEAHITAEVEKGFRLHCLSRLMYAPGGSIPTGARELCQLNLNDVTCGRSSELRGLNIIRLLCEDYEIRPPEGIYACEKCPCTKILVDGSKLSSLLAERGKSDKRYIIVCPHWNPLFDFKFTFGLKEYMELHVQKITGKADLLMKGYNVVKEIKLFHASSYTEPMGSTTHHTMMDTMHNALGVKIDGKSTHIPRKAQPVKMERGNVPAAAIERIGWLTGDNVKRGESFSIVYLKEFPREVVQYNTGMFPNGNHEGRFKAPRFNAPPPSPFIQSYFFPQWVEFEEAVKDPDHPIFLSDDVINEVDDVNEWIGMDQPLEEGETLEDLAKRAEHHCKNGK
ncbi:hypothetical protein HDU79_010749, partial [Rhizoclosmatium sp. JEL0117]